MNFKSTILDIHPSMGVPGCELVINCEYFDVSNPETCQVFIGSELGHIVSASSRRVVVTVPRTFIAADPLIEIRLVSGSKGSDGFLFRIAKLLVDNIHPVANPVFDIDSGNIYTTFSGSRGKKVDTSIWQISSTGKATSFLTGIVNPTGLAFDSSGALFVTSRHDGNIYKISPFKDLKIITQDLGVITGIAFDRQDRMFVGDRQGVIYYIDQSGTPHRFALIEASVSAFHLAFGPDGYLYVSGPTAAGSGESIYKIDQDGNVTSFYTGLGRPQGMTFDVDGNLYVAASLKGQRGIIRISPSGEDVEVFIAGNRLVGLAFDDKENIILAATRQEGGELYLIHVGVKGYISVQG